MQALVSCSGLQKELRSQHSVFLRFRFRILDSRGSNSLGTSSNCYVSPLKKHCWWLVVPGLVCMERVWVSGLEFRIWGAGRSPWQHQISHVCPFV